MSDEIAVASLLMAMLAILYGAWYSEIMKAVNLDIPKHDKQINLCIAKEALYKKCLPLFALSILTTAVFTPSLISIVLNSISIAKNNGLDAYKSYSAVKTAFCLVIASCFLISFQMYLLTYRLFNKCKKLK
ncbi:hypothetical protein FX197_13670 [Salmonella enterica]|nr:hypothetical protein [Salmonella enterica]